MVVTRRRLHRRETLPDSGVDRRRRRLTSFSPSALTLTTITHRSHGEAGVFCKSTLFADRRLHFLTHGLYFNVSHVYKELKNCNIYIKRVIFLPNNLLLTSNIISIYIYNIVTYCTYLNFF